MGPDISANDVHRLLSEAEAEARRAMDSGLRDAVVKKLTEPRVCYLCKVQFHMLDLVCVEPGGGTRHWCFCPEFCKECGYSMTYTVKRMVCRRCEPLPSI
jgi:hypothetical protein